MTDYLSTVGVVGVEGFSVRSHVFGARRRKLGYQPNSFASFGSLGAASMGWWQTTCGYLELF